MFQGGAMRESMGVGHGQAHQFAIRGTVMKSIRSKFVPQVCR